MPPKIKIIIAINSTWNFVNFRSGLIRSLLAQGYDVLAVAPADEYVPDLLALGCRFMPLPMDVQGTHPVRDLCLFLRFLQLFVRERPSVYLGYTIKPNIYGALAARCLGIPSINNIAGLGTALMHPGWLARLVRGLYRIALRRAAMVFFQNPQDRQLFISSGLVSTPKTAILPGSGVDLQHFQVVPYTLTHGAQQGRFRFLLVARMLWDKGVGEYVAAARALQPRWPQVEWCLLGFVEVKNPTAISQATIADWVAEGIVNYLGQCTDVRPALTRADCVVLPSYYREGTPRSLLEAAALGRPIITTDAVGCREVVEDGHNGLLCQPRNAVDLAEKMETMLRLSVEARAAMGLAGRAKMVAQFDEQLVIKAYLQAIQDVVPEEESR